MSNDRVQSPRLDLLQITLIVEDLEKTLRDFEDALGLRVTFRDPGVGLWGLENAVLPMGTTFIELLSPLREDTPGGRHLARQGGDGGYMVILQTDDLDVWRAPLEANGVRIAWEGSTHDEEHGLRWSGLHLHPRDTGGMMISLDRPDPPDSWAGAGPHWQKDIVQDVVDALVAIELGGVDPGTLAARWAQTLDRPLDPSGSIALDRGSIAFGAAKEGANEGLSGVSLRAVDRARVGETIRLGGVSFHLV
jgi:catechol 2,3-dioxygenase-like lactoylglutathione lyase family enzyme